MKKLAILSICLASLILLGCGDSYETLRKKQLETVIEANWVLTGIKDRVTAEGAKAKLKTLGDQWRSLAARMEKVKSTEAERKQALSLNQQLTQEIIKFTGQSIRVVLIPGGKEALEQIGDLKKK